MKGRQINKEWRGSQLMEMRKKDYLNLLYLILIHLILSYLIL